MICSLSGDVVGQPGRRAISDQLPTLHQRFKLDLVVANAENIADGAGITRKTAMSCSPRAWTC